jgi:signal-transduction protein with cAMP-binding, CBS, and nucleotidyltransferase domain
MSDSLEDGYRLKTHSSSMAHLEVIEYVPPEYQIQLMNKLFGENFQRNSFFDKLDVSFTILLLADIKMEHIREGEYIYHVHQPSTHFFLILEGRVNCLLTRNLCFKTYTKGSYFGDIECLRNSPRLFSVRAQEPTVLMRISFDTLEAAFKAYPSNNLLIMRRSFLRYMDFKHSVKIVAKFERITMNDTYWLQRREFVGTDSTINRKLESAVTNFWEDLAELRFQYALLTAGDPKATNPAT